MDKMVSVVLSRAPAGLDAPLVRAEVHLGIGLPVFAIVGLPETVVRESKERVRSAIANAGYEFPMRRITVNLAPADLPKEGNRFDLPIALGILVASDQLSPKAVERREFYGELSLNAELRGTRALLPSLRIGAGTGRDLIIPKANEVEAGFIASDRIRLAETLQQVCAAITGGAPLPTAAAAPTLATDLLDFSDVRGQWTARRALEIAAAGAHALLFIGPPGSGKTMLAQRLPGLLPPLTADEALQVASIASISGFSPDLARRPPFRQPQHTASLASMIGGGAQLRPGELSLAHCGVLFLDELPEFARDTLESLREPLETGVVVLSRAKRVREFPARFQLIAAMNPCPCGYLGSSRCRCTAEQVARYRGKLSGPLLDRLDMHVEFGAVPSAELLGERDPNAECTAAVRTRVLAARAAQIVRQGKLNARLAAAEIGAHCRLDKAGRALLEQAIAKLGLSARAYHRVLKVARSCADLAERPAIGVADIAEAIRLRCLDRAVARD